MSLEPDGNTDRITAVFSLIRTSGHIQHKVAEVLDGVVLSNGGSAPKIDYADLMILKSISQESVTVAPEDLKRGEVSHMRNVVQRIRRLGDKGLVLRTIDQENKKRLPIVLTKEGEELLSLALPIVDDCLRAAFRRRFGDSSEDTLQTLSVICNNMEWEFNG